MADAAWTSFEAWLAERRFEHPPLRLAEFAETGRGLMATEDLEVGDAVVKVPARLLLTQQRTTRLFGGSKAIAGLKQHASISLFLAWHAALGYSEWAPYIDTASKQRRNMEADHASVQDALATVDSEPLSAALSLAPSTTGLQERAQALITKNLFVWAWLVVNTRCITLNTDASAAQSLLDKQPRIALAPFLDCLNHTPISRIQAGLDRADRAYVIRTLVAYPKGSQVFINYGPHDNAFLLSEYGFVVSENPYNHVCLDAEMDCILQRMPSAKSILVAEDYTVSRDDIGYRFLNAMRLMVAASRTDDRGLLMLVPSWRKILNGETSHMSEDLEALVITNVQRLLQE
ncbi:hypothetical protein HK105_204025 [Polyrhizophydium stewartii]|uniref:SET domain-containing protein n=1 Tax=Polyrhizophydium stewartii TaxID=2732419 RepID=A0ABR4N9T1_9FUNG